MTSPQTTSQATELADKPVQSMDIWQAYAAAQDELREANAALKMYRDTNHVLSETLRVVKEALEAAYRELKEHDADYQHCTPINVNNMIVDALASSQAPVTDGVATGWRPIETAPFVEDLSESDPERLLVWVENGGQKGDGVAAFGYAFRSRDGSVRLKADGYLGFKVTLWQSIPSGPEVPHD